MQETWDAGSIPRSGRSPGEEHGNPLQYTCLENPTDRGAWRALVLRVTKSWTWLKWLSTHVRPPDAFIKLLDSGFHCPLIKWVEPGTHWKYTASFGPYPFIDSKISTASLCSKSRFFISSWFIQTDVLYIYMYMYIYINIYIYIYIYIN